MAAAKILHGFKRSSNQDKKPSPSNKTHANPLIGNESSTSSRDSSDDEGKNASTHSNNPLSSKGNESISSNSSDDEDKNAVDGELDIMSDDLSFEDDDEDEKSIQEDPQDKYLPSTDHYRRVILQSITKVSSTNIYNGKIDDTFIPQEFQLPSQLQQSSNKKLNLNTINNCIMIIRKRSVDRKKKSSHNVERGYRFPLKHVIETRDRCMV